MGTILAANFLSLVIQISSSNFEDPTHWPSLRQLEKVAHAFGQQLVISMKPLVQMSST